MSTQRRDTIIHAITIPIIMGMQDQIAALESRLSALERRKPKCNTKVDNDSMSAVQAEMVAKLKEEQAHGRAEREAQKRELEEFVRAFKDPNHPEHTELVKHLKEVAAFDHIPRFPCVGIDQDVQNPAASVKA